MSNILNIALEFIGFLDDDDEDDGIEIETMSKFIARRSSEIIG